MSVRGEREREREKERKGERKRERGWGGREGRGRERKVQEKLTHVNQNRVCWKWDAHPARPVKVMGAGGPYLRFFIALKHS